MKYQTVILSTFVITVSMLGSYGLMQQVLRQSANDPQIQLVEDAVARLEAGEQPSAVVPPTRVDIATSLSPFVIVYALDGTPLAGSGMLDGTMPTVPIELLHGGPEPAGPLTGSYLAETWQPRPGIRHAVVTEQTSGANGETVLAGRSLVEVERRTRSIGQLALLVWLVGTIGLVGLSLGIRQLGRN